MIIRVDFEDPKGLHKSVIFGHEKNALDWKANIKSLIESLQKQLEKAKKDTYGRVKILSVASAKGYSPSGFKMCSTGQWNKITKLPFPKFEEPSTQTKNSVFKLFGITVLAGKSEPAPAQKEEDGGEEETQ